MNRISSILFVALLFLKMMALAEEIPHPRQEPWCPTKCCDENKLRVTGTPIQLYKEPDIRKPLMVLGGDVKMRFLRGLDKFEPLQAKVIYPLTRPEPIQKGETLYLLNHGAEGFQKALYHGKEIEVEAGLFRDDQMCTSPDQYCWYKVISKLKSQKQIEEWWVEVLTSDGARGWIINNGFGDPCCYVPYGEPDTTFDYKSCNG